MRSGDSKIKIKKGFNNNLECEIINDNTYYCASNFKLISINKLNMNEDVLIEIAIICSGEYKYKGKLGVSLKDELIYNGNICKKIFVQEIKMVDNNVNLVLKVPSHLVAITDY